MSATAFHWIRPEWLWALLPVAGVLALLWKQRDSGGSWARVIDPELLPLLRSEVSYF